jgi:hypothetical protein
MLTPPRYFVDFTVPLRGDGSLLLRCSQPGDYEAYVHWLADYLHEADLQLSPSQRDWLDRFQGSPSDLIFCCSDCYGYAVDWLEIVDSYIKDDLSYAEYQASMEPHWREANEDFDDPENQWSFEDYLGVTEREYNTRKGELAQVGEGGQNWDHADIPFRSLLCYALRRIDSHNERYREMDFYFRNFSDNASK